MKTTKTRSKPPAKARVTESDLDALSDRFAGHLAATGTQAGDRVGVMLPNVPQFAIAYYGALKAGAAGFVVKNMKATKLLDALEAQVLGELVVDDANRRVLDA